MIKLYEGGAFLKDGVTLVPESEGAAAGLNKDDAKKGTIA